MSYFNEPRHNESSQQLQVWCCGHCRDVHFKAGNVLLNFSKTEFADLTQAVMDIYQKEFGGLEFYRLINTVSREDDDILTKDTIA